MDPTTVPKWVMKIVAWAVRHSEWLAVKVNAWAIDGLVTVCRPRPHPWSTAHPYVSWTSLTNRTYSARHLRAEAAPPSAPPIADLVEMFRRPDHQQRLCPKSSCLFPAFAQYLTDGFIRTKMPHADQPDDLRKENTSNHQIDLSTLYGCSLEEITALRMPGERPGEKGRLKSQFIDGQEFSPFLYESDGKTRKPEFAILPAPLGEDRLPFVLGEEGAARVRAKFFAVGGDRVNAAPQVAMVNSLFLREHNRLVGRLEAQHPDWDSGRLFETARNIIIVLFIKIVVEEYINHISPSPIPFRADPSIAWRSDWNRPNWLTTEFSLLYRWHSMIPDVMNWGGRAYPVQQTLMNNALLLDTGVRQSFEDLSTQQAGQLGAFNTATALLPFEERAIFQGRFCEVAPYVKYKAYMGQPVPKNFEDVSSNHRVVSFLRSQYQLVEDIDYYVGLFAEDLVENCPLPRLILSMVAVDAFSQALTNPLLSKTVYGTPDVKLEAFTQLGIDTIDATRSLRDVLLRNEPAGTQLGTLGMTLPGWVPT